ncbi:MAG: hypothetical protein AAF632_28105 [Bacteroidota bacterium]
MKPLTPIVILLSILASPIGGYGQLHYTMLPLDWQVTTLDGGSLITTITATKETLCLGREEAGLWLSHDQGASFQPDATFGANRQRRIISVHEERGHRLWLRARIAGSPVTYKLYRKDQHSKWQYVDKGMDMPFYVDTSDDTTRYYSQDWKALSAIFQYRDENIDVAQARKMAINAEMRCFSIDSHDGMMYYYVAQHVGEKDGFYRLSPGDITSPERLPAHGLAISHCYDLIVSSGKRIWLTDHHRQVWLSENEGVSFRRYSDQFSHQREIDLLCRWNRSGVLAFDRKAKQLLILYPNRVEALYGLQGSRITAVHRDPYQKMLYVATTGTGGSVYGGVHLNRISYRELAIAQLKAKR